MRIVASIALGVTFLFGVIALAADKKEELLSKYRNKAVVVLREGIAIGICRDHPGREGLMGEEVPSITVKIRGKQSEYKGASFVVPMGCGEVVPEPIKKGEVLSVKHVAYHGGSLNLNVENVSPHAVERGVGAYGHDSPERGAAFIRFFPPDGASKEDFGTLAAGVELWLKLFDSIKDAAAFGNTASGVFVKEVKIGMSFAEVEVALGLPQTRVDLGEKLLYKYKDLTVEFHNGKVTDVR